jgi:hypothetical protein
MNSKCEQRPSNERQEKSQSCCMNDFVKDAGSSSDIVVHLLSTHLYRVPVRSSSSNTAEFVLHMFVVVVVIGKYACFITKKPKQARIA